MLFPETIRGEGPIVETVTRIATDPFFGAIEVSWIKDPEVRREVARILELGHLDVVFCAGPPILIDKMDLNSEREGARKEAIEALKGLIDQADLLGSKIFVLCSGPDPNEGKREEARRRLVDSLRELCEYVEGKGLDLAISLEYFDRDVDKRLLIGPSQEAAEIAEAVRRHHGNFGLTVDLSHLPLLGERSEEALKAVEDHLIHVHIGNCVLEKESPAYGDKHPRFGIKGGEVDVKELREFLEALRQVGYFEKRVPTSLPVVSFEVRPLPGESPELVMASAKRVLKDALSIV